MKTLVIYDEKGNVLMTRGGESENPVDVSCIVKDIPDGYYVESVNTETKEPVLKEFPKSDTDRRLEELEAQVAALTGTEE